MDRVIIFPGESAVSGQDVLIPAKSVYIALAKIAETLWGKSTVINNFACTPLTGLNVSAANGEVYAYVNVDVNSWGVLPPDSTQILKQGIILTPTSFATPAPSGSGNAINYLIEVAFEEVDVNPTPRTFVNSAPPYTPYTDNVNTLRQDTALVQIKAGTEAPVGTQITPSPDAGFVGAWVITVNYGETQIISGNITVYPGAPFITALSGYITQAFADARYALQTGIQNNAYIIRGSTETSVNNYNIVDPSLTIIDNLELYFYVPTITGGASNGAVFVGLNGTYKQVVIINNDGNVALAASEIVENYHYRIHYLAAIGCWILLNPIWSRGASFSSAVSPQASIPRIEDIKDYVSSFVKGTAVYKTRSGFTQYSVSGVIASVAYVSNGYSQITFSPSLANANYGVIIFATEIVTSGGSDGSILARELSPTVSGFKVHTMAHWNDKSATDADCEMITVLVI
jgi:hypothetical protein